VAGLFGFRRRERAADAAGGDPPDTADLDTGVARADGALEWVGADDEGTLPSPVTPTGPSEHERSDPARAATEGV
jgi:hypothetical protein